MSNYYPIFVNLKGKPCLVVGGGEVALGKVPGLLEAQAEVTLVAPDIHPQLWPMRSDDHLILKHRPFEKSDLEGMFLVIAATDDRALNAQIHRRCEAAGILVNVVDDTPLCNFILPSIAKSGPLQVAVSTSGTSPTLAREIRKKIQATILRPELANLATFLGAWRSRINPLLPTFAIKKTFWRGVMQSKANQLARAGQFSKASRLLLTLLTEIRLREGLHPITSVENHHPDIVDAIQGTNSVLAHGRQL